MALVARRVGDDALEVVGDPPDVHDFPEQWVQRHLAEGRLSLARGRIVLHGPDSDVAYRIVRTPGAYCVKCGTHLGDSPATVPAVTKERKEHVAQCDGDGDDPQNPAGYEFTRAYRTELEG